MGYPKHLVIRPYSSVTTLAEERKRVTPLSTSFDIIAPMTRRLHRNRTAKRAAVHV